MWKDLGSIFRMRYTCIGRKEASLLRMHPPELGVHPFQAFDKAFCLVAFAAILVDNNGSIIEPLLPSHFPMVWLIMLPEGQPSLPGLCRLHKSTSSNSAPGDSETVPLRYMYADLRTTGIISYNLTVTLAWSGDAEPACPERDDGHGPSQLPGCWP
jgi:hypothetical protein